MDTNGELLLILVGVLGVGSFLANEIARLALKAAAGALDTANALAVLVLGIIVLALLSGGA